MIFLTVHFLKVLLPSTLLSHLLEPDCGTVSPNPSTGHLLKQVGLANKSGVSATSLLAEAGCLYLWAQNLAGLDFPKNFARSNDSNDAKSDADNAAEGKDENGSANSSSASAPNVVVMRQISVKEEFSEMKVKVI